jgi:hypothetical protein
MLTYEMLCHVALVRIGVSEEPIAVIIKSRRARNIVSSD